MITPRSRRPNRPVRPSSAPVGRPRRVAGSTSAPVDRPAAEPVEPSEPPAPPALSGDDPTAVREPLLEPLVVEPVAAPRPGPPVATIVLSVLVVLLLALGIAEVRYLRSGRDDAPAAAVGPGANPTDVPTTLGPIAVSDFTVHSVVDQAAHDALTILSVDYRTYDQQVAKATALMMPAFAAQFASTKQDIKAKFVAQKAAVSVTVANQGVVSATPDQIQVLLFLTEQTAKPAGSTNAQFRVVVTMAAVGDGWKVAQLKAL